MQMTTNSISVAKLERAEKVHTTRKTITTMMEKATTTKVEKAQSTESPTLTMAVKVETPITKITRTARVAREVYITTIMPITMTIQVWTTSFIINQQPSKCKLLQIIALIDL